MLLYGASGHAKVIIDILKSQNINIECVFDDNPEKKIFLDHIVKNVYDPRLFSSENMIISIGDNRIRKNKSLGIKHNYGIAIHSSSIISPSAIIKDGTVIMPGTVIQSSVSIGSHVIINTSASVDHDCVIDDFAHISPGATLCGNIIVGEGSHIGAKTVVIPNIKIGKWVTIGAGTVVLRDVPDYALVVGNPGKIIKIKANRII